MANDIKLTKPKPFVFVLMPFDKEFDDIYKFGIKGAADDANCYAERVDEQIFTEGILDRIFNQISKADVIVADMTGRNPNVFYEVGYAHALNKMVLPLTQKADDIPFDLKHRQHTLYEGSIQNLRKELTEKLIWAVRESQARGTHAISERFLVSLSGNELSEGLYDESAFCFRGTLSVSSQSFYLPFGVRNGGLETTPAISHIYLFGKEDSSIVPSSFPGGGIVYFSHPPSLPSFSPGLSTTKAVPPDSLDSFLAATLDSEDGLVKQYRLHNTLPPLPPGAVETINIAFTILKKGMTDIEGTFRLRIHSAARYHDFPFTIRLELADDKKS